MRKEYLKKKMMKISKLLLIVGCVIEFGFTTQAIGYSRNIPTPYYQQETRVWCGPASAQMILNSEKIKRYETQQTLWDYIKRVQQVTGWFTDPTSLAKTLTHYDETFPGYYVVYSDSDPQKATKKLAYTIYRYNVPPAALIYNGRHWVVVRGVRASTIPTWDGKYEIYGFWVNDPWYGINTLGANKYITYNNWVNNYFTPVRSAPWRGFRVSVCDPEEVTSDLLLPPMRPMGGRSIMTPEEAILSAEIAVKSHNLITLVKDFKPQIPLWVNWFGKENCYSVPWVNSSGNVTAVVTIDAFWGDLIEVSYAPESTTSLNSFYAGQSYPFIVPDKPSARDVLPGEEGIPQTTIIPEPSTLLLLGGGIGFLARYLRKKKSNRCLIFYRRT